MGSGGTGKTNVGGPSSAFGIWHELLDEVKAVVAKHKLQVVRIHTHIGSGSDPDVWTNVATLSLNLVRGAWRRVPRALPCRASLISHIHACPCPDSNTIPPPQQSSPTWRRSTWAAATR